MTALHGGRKPSPSWVESGNRTIESVLFTECVLMKMMCKRWSMRILKQFVPSRVYWSLLAWKVRNEEKEMQLLPWLCDKSKVALDIGALGGSYSVHLVRYTKRCIAFEAVPSTAERLRAKLMFCGDPRLQVESTAIGDRSGEAQIRVPMRDMGRSTLAPTNSVGALGDLDIISVPVRRLDDYQFGEPVGFIKIDVEGHEEAVLQGAKSLLAEDRPRLLIEIEERHNPGAIERISVVLKSFGYSGYFFHAGLLEPLAHFDAASDQCVGCLNGDPAQRTKYINNFVFLLPEHHENLRPLLKSM